MAVYVDKLRNWGWRLGPSSHLIADTLDELNRFALSIGLRLKWLQLTPVPHYDLTIKNRMSALTKGAIELETRDFVEKMRSIRDDK